MAGPTEGDIVGTPTGFVQARLGNGADIEIAAIDVTLNTGQAWNIAGVGTGTGTASLTVGSITRSGNSVNALNIGDGAAGRIMNLDVGSGGITLNGGRMDFSLGVRFDVSGLFTFNAGDFRLSSTETTRNFDGGISFAGTGTQTFNVNTSATTGLITKFAFIEGGGTNANVTGHTSGSAVTDTVEVNGTTGTHTYAGQISNGAGAGRTVKLTKTGANTQILSRAGGTTYGGGTEISAGTLLITNTSGNGTGTGTVTVSGTGTFGGTGITSGAVTVSAGAAIQGGDGTNATGGLTLSGNLTLNDGTFIKLALGGGNTHSSLIRTGGTWSFDSDQAFTFTIVPGAGIGPYENIISGLAGDPGSTASWTISNNSEVTGTFSYNGSGGVDLLVTAIIPEPSVVALMLLGSLCTVVALRRARLGRLAK